MQFGVKHSTAGNHPEGDYYLGDTRKGKGNMSYDPSPQGASKLVTGDKDYPQEEPKPHTAECESHGLKPVEGQGTSSQCDLLFSESASARRQVVLSLVDTCVPAPPREAMLSRTWEATAHCSHPTGHNADPRMKGTSIPDVNGAEATV